MATSTIRNLPSIVEQGTSGNWTYRKWSDGTAECWIRDAVNEVNFSTKYGNGYYASQLTYAFPTNIFVSVPMVQVSMQDGGGYGSWFSLAGVTNTSLHGYPYATTQASNINCAIYIYAIGKWK